MAKKQTNDRNTLADCVVGEVAILRDPVVDGQLRTIPPNTAVKVWWLGEYSAFVSAIAGGVESPPTHVAVTARLKGMAVKKMGEVEVGRPQELDPLQRATSLL